jgi:hypothetical protein
MYDALGFSSLRTIPVRLRLRVIVFITIRILIHLQRFLQNLSPLVRLLVLNRRHRHNRRHILHRQSRRLALLGARLGFRHEELRA